MDCPGAPGKNQTENGSQRNETRISGKASNKSFRLGLKPEENIRIGASGTSRDRRLMSKGGWWGVQ